MTAPFSSGSITGLASLSTSSIPTLTGTNTAMSPYTLKMFIDLVLSYPPGLVYFHRVWGALVLFLTPAKLRVFYPDKWDTYIANFGVHKDTLEANPHDLVEDEVTMIPAMPSMMDLFSMMGEDASNAKVQNADTRIRINQTMFAIHDMLRNAFLGLMAPDIKSILCGERVPEQFSLHELFCLFERKLIAATLPRYFTLMSGLFTPIKAGQTARDFLEKLRDAYNLLVTFASMPDPGKPLVALFAYQQLQPFLQNELRIPWLSQEPNIDNHLGELSLQVFLDMVTHHDNHSISSTGQQLTAKAPGKSTFTVAAVGTTKTGGGAAAAASEEFLVAEIGKLRLENTQLKARAGGASIAPAATNAKGEFYCKTCSESAGDHILHYHWFEPKYCANAKANVDAGLTKAQCMDKWRADHKNTTATQFKAAQLAAAKTEA